jgi:hypothetical protein
MLSMSGWTVMAHGVIFIDYNQQGGPRGEGKAESVNWGMVMEQHRLGPGTILLRQMFSAESLTSPHPGFPELFQTGETYHGFPVPALPVFPTVPRYTAPSNRALALHSASLAQSPTP